MTRDAASATRTGRAPKPPSLFHRAEPLVIHRLHRGELNKPQEVVEPGLPVAALLPASRSSRARLLDVAPGRRRAALADWLTSRENPLVARVVAIRVWGWHFGRGIVRTPNDFGKQGEEPTHPELLDYLAEDLIEHGWSLKRLHRLIVLSSTYRMASGPTDPAAREDAENRLLSRFPRRRLEGEEIRDAMLACSGQLNLKRFGKPVVPPLGKDELTGLFDARAKWPVTKEVSEHTRRSVYLLVRRTFTYPMFSSFDPPELMTSCARRMQTIVPAQALTLLNSLADRPPGGVGLRGACPPGKVGATPTTPSASGLAPGLRPSHQPGGGRARPGVSGADSGRRGEFAASSDGRTVPGPVQRQRVPVRRLIARWARPTVASLTRRVSPNRRGRPT